MRTRTVLGILGVILLAAGARAQTASEAGRFDELWRTDGKKALPELRQKLRTGTPVEKEQVLYLFMEQNIVDLVPDVIQATLDDTTLPKHDDTGWGRVHHQAATALCKFAQRIDGKTQEARGRQAYSFHDDGGVGTQARREEIHANWVKWWEKNKKKIEEESTKARPAGS